MPFHLRPLARAIVLLTPSVLGALLAAGALAPLPWEGRATAARNGHTPPADSTPDAAANPTPAATAEPFDESVFSYREIWLPTEEALPIASQSQPAVGTQGRPAPPPPVPLPAVPPSEIRRMSIPRLGVNHYVESVAIRNGEMQAPVDGVYAVGWYYDFGPPGTGGNAVFSAHETWNRFQGPFYNLHRAQGGDEILIEMRDGRRFRYVVTSNVRYEVEHMPMAEILWPPTRGSQEWITLITCGGRIVYNSSGFGEYLDRDVVVARRVE